MAVDDLKALAPNFLRERADGLSDAAGEYLGVDAKLARLVGKRSVGKADEPDGLRFAQPFQQRQDVRFRAADVAAGDEGDNFHARFPCFIKSYL